MTFLAGDVDGVTTQNVNITVTPIPAPDPATGAVIVAYTFTGNTNIAAMVAANVTASRFTANDDRAMTYPAGNPSPAISASGWAVEGRYWEFSLTVADGFDLSITNVSFDNQRSATGPDNWFLRTSLDDYADDIASGASSTNITMDGVNAPLSLSGITGTITFRLYGDEAITNSGTWRIDNFILLGSVLGGEEPEPPVEQVIVEFMISSGLPTITLGGSQAGVNYRLRYTTNLLSPQQWMSIGAAAPGTGGELEFSDPGPDDPARLYHVEAVKP